MHHPTSLIATIVAGLVLAFLLGALANRLRISPLVGYLLAGVMVGPYTPGFVADQELTPQLAEIGVILLMFGVGLHFSPRDLLSVKTISVPGALVQIAVATSLGLGLGLLLGWPVGAGLVFGLALSVASTVVLLRSLQEHRMVETERGRIAVGWLIVEDLAMVLALMLLPLLPGLLAAAGAEGAGGTARGVALGDLLEAVGITLGKVAAFVLLMMLVGRRVIPWLLHTIVYTGSRELFRLAALAIALGVAYGSAELFGVSFALGAFFAGMVLSESELSQRAAEESLPLRDAFAVLFFVSVGMLFDPGVLLREPWPLLATLGIILVGKSLAALLIVLAFRHPLSTALIIAASLAQIGEFSFILAGLGMQFGLLPAEAHDLILGGAILSILANPLLFYGAMRFLRSRERAPRPSEGAQGEASSPAEAQILLPTSLTGHTVLIGYGRVGGLIGEGLIADGVPLLVIEERSEPVERLRTQGIEALLGSATDPDLLSAANLSGARRLIVAIPNGFEAGRIIELARQASPGLEILARAHLDAEVEYLEKFGANLVVMGEREIARALLQRAREDRDETAGGGGTPARGPSGTEPSARPANLAPKAQAEREP